MKVHHLNCGTLNPVGAAPHVCHVLLVETNSGLVLVDTGFGSHDLDEPSSRIGPIRHLIRPRLSSEETASVQVKGLGFDVADVRHIVATHLDIDHIGGVSDFPHAQLHTTATEVASAYSSRLRSRLRYNRSQLPQNAATIHGHATGTDTWRGFTNITPLSAIDEGIALIPLPGHTAGHTAVAVDAGHRWVLHCGDAFYHRNTVRAEAKTPRTSRIFESLAAEDRRQVARNHDRLKTLNSQQDPTLLIVCAHDRKLLKFAQQTS